MNRFAFLGLVVGVFAWTAVVSIMNGLQGDMKTRILREKPHLLWEGTPRSDLESKEGALKKALGTELSNVKFILQTEGLIEVPNQQQQGRISGSGVVIQGIEGLGNDAEAGSELASLLRVTVGDEIRLHSVWRLDLPPLELRLMSLFQTGVYEIDRSGVHVDRRLLENWLGLKDAVSRVEIQIKDPARVSEYRAAAEKALGVPLKTWQETEASLWYSLKLEKIVMGIAVFFIVLIASMAVHLALSVRVADKTREIGLLRGLGADDKILARLYLSEGLVLGVAGSFVGLFVSWAFCKIVSGYYQFPDIYYFTTVPVDWNWGTCIGLSIIAVILALFASWLPANRVKNVEVHEALRS
jgi:lipoprotein-releasing system permease protein